MYGSWVLVMGETIYAKDGEKFTEKLCPTKGPWFEKLMRGLKLRMGLIKKQDFGVIIKMINAILRGLDTDWKGEGSIWRRDISCKDTAVVIVLFGKEVFLAFLEGILDYWRR